jgi:hypothetical protein
MFCSPLILSSRESSRTPVGSGSAGPRNIELTIVGATMSFKVTGVSSETAMNSHFPLQSHISGRRQVSCRVHNDVNQANGLVFADQDFSSHLRAGQIVP